MNNISEEILGEYMKEFSSIYWLVCIIWVDNKNSLLFILYLSKSGILNFTGTSTTSESTTGTSKVLLTRSV